LGSQAGLYRFEPRTKEVAHFEAMTVLVASMMLGKNGRLWIGSLQDGIIWFDTETETVVRQISHDAANPHSLNGDAIQVLYKDAAMTSDRDV
jgi:ligand-binding sensor domain-containing protein